jgi:hypothetical protein
MKHILSFLLLFFILAQAHGQVSTPLSVEEQNSLLQKVSSVKNPDDRLKAIDELIRSGQLTLDGQLAAVYSGRAKTMWEAYLNHTETSDPPEKRLQVIDTVLLYYKKAIDACVFCQPVHRQERAEFLKDVDLANTNPLYLQDIDFAKAHGYKETEKGFVLGLNYMGGKSDFAGIMVSPWGQVIPRYKVMSTDPADGKLKIVDQSLLPVSINILAFEYNRNLDQPTSREFTLSLFQSTSPLLINVTKFGFTKSVTLSKPSWFYRPEIGIGWSFISVGYAYNFVFSKSDRSQLNTHMVVARLCYPIVMYKN